VSPLGSTRSPPGEKKEKKEKSMGGKEENKERKKKEERKERDGHGPSKPIPMETKEGREGWGGKVLPEGKKRLESIWMYTMQSVPLMYSIVFTNL